MKDNRKDRAHKIAAFSGWFFVALLVAANLLPGLPPNAPAPADQVAQYFAVHRTMFLFAVMLEGLSVGPLLIFAATLASDLREESSDPLPPQLIAFASVAAAVALAVAFFWAALAYEAPSGYEPSVTRAIFNLGNIGYSFIGFPFSAFI